MPLITIFFVAIGLSMDAFAVSVSDGLASKSVRLSDGFKLSAFFGIAQGIMPLIGFFAGRMFSGFITAVDHWIAFGLLVFIGGKMAAEVFKKDDDSKQTDVFSIKSLFFQAIATSIDALAVGIGFSVLPNINPFSASLLITVTTFAFCLIGVFIGRFLGTKIEKYALIMGGLILVAIGFKILIEHLFF